MPGAGIALSLMLTSFITHAQDVAPGATPKWYVGGQVSANHQVYIVGQGMGFGAPTTTVGGYGGYQLSPQLAVQAGLSYGRGSTPAEAPSGQFNYYPQAEYVTSLLTLPVLLRWDYVTQPRRFRLEGLAGLHVSYFNLRQRSGHLQTEPRFVTDSRGVNGYLDLGLGGRVQLGSRLEVAADLLLNVNLQHPSNFYFPLAPGGSAALGLHYRLQ
ncbi:hypothetical protein GCM10022409_19070 [Hymenobacter glaciei]|uniref:Outer membrane protein beta-barrel domain-containing protein n=1 Tax=Hymenobacter glaciei TaxID=877209 RepID=A0ABP7U261_9BACT